MNRIFIKTPSTESRCVIGPENIPFKGASVKYFSPEILQALAVKGVKVDPSSNQSYNIIADKTCSASSL